MVVKQYGARWSRVRQIVVVLGVAGVLAASGSGLGHAAHGGRAVSGTRSAAAVAAPSVVLVQADNEDWS
jgi:hypothetical protein